MQNPLAGRLKITLLYSLVRTLVIGDIHGNYSALLECLERCAFNNDKDQLIQIGDVVDGGEQSFECVEKLLTIRNLIALKGNHDQWFLEWITTGEHPAQWTYGGRATLWSYSKLVGKEKHIASFGLSSKVALNPQDIPLAHRMFFENQKLYHIDSKNRLFVHAGFNRHQDFFLQPKENYFWDRDLWMQAMEWLAKVKQTHRREPFEMKNEFHEIFIGHTQTMYWDTDRPMKANNIINIDTGARHNGKLTIMDVETKQYWQSETIFTEED